MSRETTLNEQFAFVIGLGLLAFAYYFTYSAYGPSPDANEALFVPLFILVTATYGGLFIAFFLISFWGLREQQFVFQLFVYLLLPVVALSVSLGYIPFSPTTAAVEQLALGWYVRSLLLSTISVLVGKSAVALSDFVFDVVGN